MTVTSPKVVNIFDVFSKNNKFTEVKPIKELTKQQMKSSNSFKKRDERD